MELNLSMSIVNHSSVSPELISEIKALLSAILSPLLLSCLHHHRGPKIRSDREVQTSADDIKRESTVLPRPRPCRVHTANIGTFTLVRPLVIGPRRNSYFVLLFRSTESFFSLVKARKRRHDRIILQLKDWIHPYPSISHSVCPCFIFSTVMAGFVLWVCHKYLMILMYMLTINHKWRDTPFAHWQSLSDGWVTAHDYMRW